MKNNQLIFFFIRCLIRRNTTVKKAVLFSWLVLSTCIIHAQEVKMYTGCNMVLEGNIYVVINNTALKNNGTFTAGASTVKFTGNTDTTISYLSGTSNTTFNNLTINKSAYGAALRSVAIVRNVLAVDGGNLYTDSNLTLRSDINLTARVAPVASGSNITGKANVERYIPARRAWRMLTAPVTNSNTILNSWQNRSVYTPGLGLLVTGPSPTGPAGNGLDTSTQNTASMKNWNYSTQAWASILNTKVAISPRNTGSADNDGYFIFVRGDRNPVNTTVGIDNNTTINSIGVLQTSTQIFPASSVAGKYTLIGNPYASPVDFNNVSRTNLIKRFYVWDPSLNTVGGYVMLDDLSNTNTWLSSVPASTQTKDIQSSQAFFVQTDNGNIPASITFNESSKSGNNNNTVFRPANGLRPAGTAPGLMRATLNLLNANNSTTLADGTFAEFDDRFSAVIDLDDALKFGNTNENLSIVRNNTSLTAERRPALGLYDTVYLKLTTTTKRNYQFVFDVTNLQQPGMVGYLMDSYLGTSSPISLDGTTKVNFSINAVAASAVTNRFKIIFKQTLSALPVTISSIKAYQQEKNIAVEWKVENEINMVKYDVERSADGALFSKVNTTSVTGNYYTSNTYSWIDTKPMPGNNFYRIRSYDLGGEVKYSRVVNVVMERKIIPFTILPNPVKGNTIHLQFANQPVGNYKFGLVSSNGQLVWTREIFINSSSTVQVLNTDTDLPPGVYQLQIGGPANTFENQTLIIEQ